MYLITIIYYNYYYNYYILLYTITIIYITIIYKIISEITGLGLECGVFFRGGFFPRTSKKGSQISDPNNLWNLLTTNFYVY